jgi:hypothetical protein
MMKKRYLFPLINIGSLVGCGLAIFIVPPKTNFKLFAFICVGLIIAINIAAILKVRATQKAGYVAEPPDRVTTSVIWVGFLIFLVEVVRGLLKYWHAP